MVRQMERCRRPGPNPLPLAPILDAATEVFAEFGFTGATVTAIATHCGTTKPTLYKYFADKADLYRRCLEREMDIARDHLFAAYTLAEGHSVEAEVRAYVAAVFNYALNRPQGVRLLIESNTGGPANDVRDRFGDAVVSRIAARMSTLTGLGPQSPSVRRSAGMVVGTSICAVRESLVNPQASTKQAEVMTAQFIVGGVLRLIASHKDVLGSP